MLAPEFQQAFAVQHPVDEFGGNKFLLAAPQISLELFERSDVIGILCQLDQTLVFGAWDSDEIFHALAFQYALLRGAIVEISKTSP